MDVGLRYTFNPGGVASPYVGGGGTYYLLDIDGGEIDDEVGFYVVLGSSFGDGEGADFFVEGIYRNATATVDDLDDLEFRDPVDFDLDGLGLNAGITWRF